MRVLVAYSTCEGQTLKIAKHIVGQSRFTEATVDYVELGSRPDSVQPASYDLVLIGASIRYGKFRPHLYQFLENHQQQLEQTKTAFFGVCLTARKPEKNTPSTNPYMKKLAIQASWLPEQQAVFAGALLYSKYNWWQTRIIQLIMKITGGSTDTSQDIELTDWARVDDFAGQLVNLVPKGSK